MKRKPVDDLALTDEEIDALSSTRTPEAIRTFTSRQQRTLGIRTSAYRKVAAAAKAEREALTEIALLAIARGGDAPTPSVPAIASTEAALVATVEQQRRQIAALSATGAEVVHGD